MEKMNESFTYKLSSPIVYSKDGEDLQCYELEFIAPSYRTYGYATKIEQAITRALMQANKLREETVSNTAESKENIEQIKNDIKERKQLVTVAFLMSNENLEFCISDFINMCENVCNIEPNKPLLKKYFNKINYKDLKDMFFEYVANFLMPSFYSET